MRIFVTAFVLMAGYVVIYASAVELSKDRIVAELIQSARDGDADALRYRLDFRALRSFMKSDLKKKARSMRGGSIAIPIGPEPEQISDLVDFYIQPERIDMLLDLKPKIFPDADPEDFVWDVDFRGPFAFVVTVGYPTPEGEQTLYSERMSTIKFVFKGHGWIWRAKEMHVPLFLVPREKYSDEEIEELLSRTFP